MAVNFALIGYGRMATLAHEPLIRKTAGARLLAVFDVTPSRREAARQAGIERVYATLPALLKDPDVQCVTICTPSHSHVAFGTKAARAGKHVITEKPAARSAAEWRRMIALARRAGVLLTVFHNRRWDSDFLVARDIVRRRLVGDVIAVEARWQGYGSAASFGVKDFFPKWRELRHYGGGTLLDLGVHLLDQVNQMAPGRPDQVYATVRGGIWAQDCDDYASGIVHFDDGMVAHVEASAITAVKLPRWRIIGTRGMAVSNAETKRMELYLGKADKPTRTISYDRPNDWGAVYRSMVAAIRDRRKKPAVDPQSVVTTMQLIDAYRESSRTGRSVAIRGPRAK
jgi:predicted dehydrogenase